MKRALTILAAVLALPLMAGEQPAAPAAGSGVATATAQQDSPLVAAARRANRRGKKPTNLITNETLRQAGAGAHVTSTTAQINVHVSNDPLRPTPEMAAAKAAEIQRKQLEAEAARKKQAEEARLKARGAAAAAAEEDFYADGDTDPAQAEKAQQDANQQKPPHR